MSTTTVVAVLLTTAAFALLLWAIGRAVTTVGERAPHGLGRLRHYLAGRLDAVQITALVHGEDELLVSLSTQSTGATQAGDPLARVFRVTASECSLARVRRWRDESTPLRAYLSNDGTIMLADHQLGGNAACEPAITATRRPSGHTTLQDQSPTEDK
jgi:hypothetical protein